MRINREHRERVWIISTVLPFKVYEELLRCIGIRWLYPNTLAKKQRLVNRIHDT